MSDTFFASGEFDDLLEKFKEQLETEASDIAEKYYDKGYEIGLEEGDGRCRGDKLEDLADLKAFREKVVETLQFDDGMSDEEIIAHLSEMDEEYDPPKMAELKKENADLKRKAVNAEKAFYEMAEGISKLKSDLQMCQTKLSISEDCSDTLQNELDIEHERYVASESKRGEFHQQLNDWAEGYENLDADFWKILTAK